MQISKSRTVPLFFEGIYNEFTRFLWLALANPCRFSNYPNYYHNIRKKFEETSRNVKLCPRVFLLPILKAKYCFFTSLLQAFIETFASLSGTPDSCVLWNEAATGRNASDVASAFALFLQSHETRFAEFLFWPDNCASQNKNWTLFSALLQIVNSPSGPRKISLQ